MTEHMLAAAATGDLRALVSGDTDHLAPFLPLLARLDLTRATASPQLLRFERSASLLDTARVLQEFTPTKYERTSTLSDSVATASPPDEPVFRAFERGDAHTRATLVLAELQQAAPPSELFANAIYSDELAALLVLALANSERLSGSDVHSPFALRAVVRFCLNAPLGVGLVQRLVENDPSAVESVLDAVLETLDSAQSDSSQSDSFPTAVVQARDACGAIARLAPAFAALARDKLSARSGGLGLDLWKLSLALHLALNEPALHADLPTFLFRLTKTEPTAFASYVSLGLVDSSELQASALQTTAAQHLSLVLQRLFERLSQATTAYDVVVVLNVLIALVVQANWRPTDQEAVQLLRWIDKAAKDEPTTTTTQPTLRTSRVVSLAFVFVLLVSYPLAPSLSKIPSLRDETTKAVLALSQQCVFSLYNTKAACPLFIVTAVLLFTKSPSLLPFVSSVVANDGLPVQALRVDFLHVVGDVVLKPILTESIMAREVLTFAPALSLSARDSHDVLSELSLRSVYGLLCEKSFLRHHHGRALEDWLAHQVERAALPVHPVLLNLLLEWVENYVVAFEYPVALKPVLQLAIVPLRGSTLTKWLSAPCLAEPFVRRGKKQRNNDSEATDGDVERAWCRGVLALTYGLHFNQRVRHARMVAGSKISAVSSDAHPPTGDVCLGYDLSTFPLRNILHEVLANGGHGARFEFVAPTLLRLMVEEFPHRVESFASVDDQRELSRCWTMGSRAQLVTAFDPHEPTAWMTLSLSLSTLETAPSRVLVRAFETVVDRILPSILLAHETDDNARFQPTAADDDSGDVAMTTPLATLPTYAEVVFAQLARLYERRVSHEHRRRTSVQMKLVHTLCFPALVRQHYATQHGASATTRGSAAALSHLVTYHQVQEEPFRVLSDAHNAVFRSPALLRVLLQLVRDVRDAANNHLRNQDAALVPRRQQLLQTAIPAPGVADPPSPSLIAKTAALAHHVLVQDCLLVHALLHKMTGASRDDGDSHDDDDVGGTRRECNRLLCGVVDALFQDTVNALLPPAKLLAAVHQQGYDDALVPVLVDAVPSMRLLWEHWMAQASTASAATSSSSSGTATSNSTRSLPKHSKVVNEFVAPDGCEKDLHTWGFRLCVFFTLCSKHFAPPSQTLTVLQTLKFVLTRLRSVLQLVLSGNSVAPSSARSSGGDELQRHAHFLDRVLPVAVAACAQHPDLSAELVQFLLKLQKQGSNSVAWRHSASTRDVAPTRDVDDVLREAYARLLQHI